jgi:hypothetical protein
MIRFPKGGDVIDLPVDGDPEVIIALVRAYFCSVPGLVEIGAEKPAKLNNPENNDTVQEEDKGNQNKLFTPRHTNVWSLHPPNVAEHKGWNPES